MQIAGAQQTGAGSQAPQAHGSQAHGAQEQAPQAGRTGAQQAGAGSQTPQAGRVQPQTGRAGTLQAGAGSQTAHAGAGAQGPQEAQAEQAIKLRRPPNSSHGWQAGAQPQSATGAAAAAQVGQPQV